jgi:hypothetical protein
MAASRRLSDVVPPCQRRISLAAGTRINSTSPSSSPRFLLHSDQCHPTLLLCRHRLIRCTRCLSQDAAFRTGEARRDEEISIIDGRAGVEFAAPSASVVLRVVFVDGEQTIHLGIVQPSLGVKKL